MSKYKQTCGKFRAGLRTKESEDGNNGLDQQVSTF